MINIENIIKEVKKKVNNNKNEKELEKITGTLKTIIFQKENFIIGVFKKVEGEEERRKREEVREKIKKEQEVVDDFNWIDRLEEPQGGGVDFARLNRERKERKERGEKFDFEPINWSERINYDYENDMFKQDNDFKAKGEIYDPKCGLSYSLNGIWETSSRYGKTFKIDHYDTTLPINTEDVISYLQESGWGVGPSTARRLTEAFGENTLEKIKRASLDELRSAVGEIKYCRVSVLEALQKKLLEIEAGEEKYLKSKALFANTNLSKKKINEIINKYGENFLEKIKADPYALIDEVESVGFRTADSIANNCGFNMKSFPRFRAAIVYVLQQSSESGHCFLNRDVLENMCIAQYNLDKISVKSCMEILEEQEKIKVDGERVYLWKLYKYECFIAKKLVELSKQKCKLLPQEVDISSLKPDQIKAFEFCKDKNLFILNGSPGTGKSHLLKNILDMYSQYECSLASFTGKASFRMTELTGRPAKTIHKLLDPQLDETTGKFVFTVDAKNPLDCNLLVVDEFSTVSLDLAYHLFSAIPLQCKVIIVGDSFQLPSIGCGNLLRDMVDSNSLPIAELVEIKRQSSQNLIVKNCARIKQGLGIIKDNSKTSDFFCIDIQEESKILNEIVSLVSGRLQKIEGNENLTFDDWVILSPNNTLTSLSCQGINNVLQEKLNGYNPYVFKSSLKIKDKILNTKNNYKLGILNGSQGYIEEAVEDYDENMKLTQFFKVKFNDQKESILIPLNDHDLKLAYCLTPFRGQGSEWPIVIIPIYSGFSKILTYRNLLYTSISRGKKMVILVGQMQEVQRMIDRNWIVQRNTYLKERLVEENAKMSLQI